MNSVGSRSRWLIASLLGLQLLVLAPAASAGGICAITNITQGRADKWRTMNVTVDNQSQTIQRLHIFIEGTGVIYTDFNPGPRTVSMTIPDAFSSGDTVTVSAQKYEVNKFVVKCSKQHTITRTTFTLSSTTTTTTAAAPAVTTTMPAPPITLGEGGGSATTAPSSPPSTVTGGQQDGSTSTEATEESTATSITVASVPADQGDPPEAIVARDSADSGGLPGWALILILSLGGLVLVLAGVLSGIHLGRRKAPTD